MEKSGSEHDIIQKYILSQEEKQDMLGMLIDNSPCLIEVFASDGTLLMINKAGVMASGIMDDSVLLGKYNIQNDLLIAGLGYLNELKKAFAGEFVFLRNVRAPLKDLRENFNHCFKGLESVYHDIFAFPLMNSGAQANYVAVFMLTRSAYTGKDAIVKAMEYMDNNWDKRFSIEDVARAAHLSSHYFSRLFKSELDITPYQYYLNVKVEMLKEKLSDSNVSIKEAFAACGIAYNGYYANVFQKKVGVKPSEYRAMMRSE